MIRRATPADALACARIVCDWEAAQPYLARRPDEDAIAGMIAQALPNREIWVTGDPVDGYMSVDPAESKIGALYLTRTGQGIGKRLMDMAKEGRDFLWLTMFAGNARAFAFYRREGFRLASPMPAGTPGATVLRMEWQR